MFCQNEFTDTVKVEIKDGGTGTTKLQATLNKSSDASNLSDVEEKPKPVESDLLKERKPIVYG